MVLVEEQTSSSVRDRPLVIAAAPLDFVALRLSIVPLVVRRHLEIAQIH